MLIPVLLGVSIIIFVLIRLTPGDPARILAGEHANQQTIQQIREKWGLNKSLTEQYFIWLKEALRGNLGRSITTHQFVVREILERFPATVELTVMAMIIAIVVGIIAGIVSATKQYSAFDYTSMVGALFGISMPVFWLGLMLMFVWTAS